MVVEKQWKKITEITYPGSFKFRNEEPAPVISAKDAKKIMLRSVDFCKALKVHLWNMNGSFEITFGPFQYKLQDVTIEHTLQFLAEHATEITEIEFCKQPKTELLQLLFAKNEIKRVEIWESKDFWKDVSTDGIEHLDFALNNSDVNLKSFEGVGTLLCTTSFRYFIIILFNVEHFNCILCVHFYYCSKFIIIRKFICYFFHF